MMTSSTTLQVIQTNLYAEEYIRTTEIPPSSRVHRWAETDVGEEMKTFIGLCLLMGVIKKPDHNLYYEQIPLFGLLSFLLQCRGQISPSLLKLWHINDNRNLSPS
ncbi:hypothetical protein RRG08_005778 [Elysia crispata]|uniref:PiggyBac transposable element-derived protein domain-containing protein n=1 Tax=Elysia crispata TaxID=231223 RepID=A0AAE1BCS0_9GAST|nr:hypothetical protein RRG08_005778 [Elysia crispata]